MARQFPVRIEKTAQGDYRLSWDEDFSRVPVRVRVHTDPRCAPQAEPLHESARSGERLVPPGAGRHYFHLEPPQGEPLTAAQRDLPLEGGTNFRDMGGYRAADGRRVRWGRLYRSGHSAGLTDSDRAFVDSLDIRVCCDFRRPEEHQIEPSRLPAGTRIAGIAISPGSQAGFFERIAAGEAGEADMVAFMEGINRDFARHHTAEYRRMFEELLALEDGAFMINCAAGKDRTGFGAALILAALGVAEEDILADYMLTRDYFPIDREMERVRRKYVPPGGRFDAALMRPMMEVRESYLGSALAEIRARHGDLPRYLARELGLGEAELLRLRERLTG